MPFGLLTHASARLFERSFGLISSVISGYYKVLFRVILGYYIIMCFMEYMKKVLLPLSLSPCCSLYDCRLVASFMITAWLLRFCRLVAPLSLQRSAPSFKAYHAQSNNFTTIASFLHLKSRCRTSLAKPS